MAEQPEARATTRVECREYDFGLAAFMVTMYLTIPLVVGAIWGNWGFLIGFVVDFLFYIAVNAMALKNVAPFAVPKENSLLMVFVRGQLKRVLLPPSLMLNDEGEVVRRHQNEPSFFQRLVLVISGTRSIRLSGIPGLAKLRTGKIAVAKDENRSVVLEWIESKDIPLSRQRVPLSLSHLETSAGQLQVDITALLHYQIIRPIVFFIQNADPFGMIFDDAKSFIRQLVEDVDFASIFGLKLEEVDSTSKKSTAHELQKLVDKEYQQGSERVLQVMEKVGAKLFPIQIVSVEPTDPGMLERAKQTWKQQMEARGKMELAKAREAEVAAEIKPYLDAGPVGAAIRFAEAIEKSPGTKFVLPAELTTLMAPLTQGLQKFLTSGKSEEKPPQT